MDFIGTRDIYSKLQDDYSRFLYEKRAMYCITSDGRYMDDILESVIDRHIFQKLMRELEKVKDKLAVRGAGNDYYVLKRLNPDFEFAFFVDYDVTKQGKVIDGKEVLTPDDFYEKYKDYYVLVNSAAANEEIVDDLKKHGISDDKIFNLAVCYEGICDKQYFEENIMKSTSGEIFVDGGCYDGRTVRQFVKWCNGDYKKIFSFEPDSQNYENAKRVFDEIGLTNIELLNRGLWSCERTLHFNADGSQGARIEENGGTTIHTASIDDVVKNERVTFIKLDVEGAEYEALIGARKTIEKNRPKLAISIYHKPQDIFELPELIMSIRDDYRMYLRHYQLSPNETILYCV